MSIFVVYIAVSISHVTSTEVMFQYEASDDTSDKMPDEFNVTFSTETKFVTKFNLRLSQSFDHDIPLYTLDVDREGFFQKQKVKTRPRKDIGYYYDINNKAVFCIKRSAKTMLNKYPKFRFKAEFQMDSSEYLFDSNKKSPTKPWRNMSFITMFNPTGNESTAPHSRTTFDPYVYKIQLLNTTFDLFDIQIPPPEVEETVRWNVINQSTPWSDPPNRRPRDTVRDYYLDIVALIDFLRYSWFLEEARNSSQSAMWNLQEHYALVFSGIDLLFKGIQHPNYTIHVRLCKIYVFQTPAAAIFLNKYAVDNKIQGTNVLEALNDFFKGVGREIVRIYDHVMLFTGYDLCSYDSSGILNNRSIGLTTLESMCQKILTGCSVIEDLKRPIIRLAAHLLGHSISAEDDGIDNPCSSNDRYIMSNDVFSIKTRETKYNPWRFSSCSVKTFTNFLTENVGSNSTRHDCLVNAIEASGDIPDVSVKQLGQIIKPDQQCQRMYGKTSFFCRDVEGIRNEDICQAMFCFDPRTARACIMKDAYDGTSCGDGKICLYGKCVSDPNAPQLDETCLFGDKDEYRCRPFISKFVGNCYQLANYVICCGTCNNMSKPIRGCEYGDRKENCQIQNCDKEKEICCGTCNYGTPFNPSEKPLLTRTSPQVARECKPGDLDLKPDLCTSLSVCQDMFFLCCAYCSRLVPKGCYNMRTNMLPQLCTSPGICRKPEIRNFCCKYCSQIENSTVVTRCAPGDLDLKPALCTNINICTTNRSLCCDYCSRMRNDTVKWTTTSTITSTITSTTSTTQLTSSKECVPGEPDLSPELCTSSSVCKTEPLMCCNYCSYNSGSILSLYDTWIYRCFYITLHFLVV